MAMSASRSTSKNVSMSVCCAEKVVISELVANINEAYAAKNSFVRHYYSSLHRKSDAGTDLVDK